MSRTKGAMTYGSIPHRLSQMLIGESFFVETTQQDYPQHMRQWNYSRSRRNELMKHWKFETRLFTAVAAQSPFDVRHIIEVRRTQ